MPPYILKIILLKCKDVIAPIIIIILFLLYEILTYLIILL
jgi:hypothetical protein